MNIWFAVSLIFAIMTLYMLAIETFSIAFKLTGLATERIKFQVASLFTSSGFTTDESEIIVNDDSRRRIAITCMYTGHIFSVVIMGLVINVLISIGAIHNNESASLFSGWYSIVFFVSLGLFLVVLFTKIPPINKRFQKFLENVAISFSKKRKSANIIKVIDYYGKNTIAEVVLNKIPDFALDTPLYEMQLTKKYQINVLSIRRGNRLVDVTKDTMFRKGDLLVIFGNTHDIKQVFINSVDKTIVVNDASNEIVLLNNYGTNALTEILVDEVPTELDNITMKDSHLTDRYNINIVVIKRDDEYIKVDKDTIIKKGDFLTLFGPYQNIKHLFLNK